MTDRIRAAEQAREIAAAMVDDRLLQRPETKEIGALRIVAIDLQLALNAAEERLREARELLVRASGRINSERYKGFQTEIAAFLGKGEL